jgi:cyclophilin family peptidyl-prolyl cis-trans isomerase
MQGQGFLPAVEEHKIPEVVAHIGMQAAWIRTRRTGRGAQLFHDRVHHLQIAGYGLCQGYKSSIFSRVTPHMVIQGGMHFPPAAGFSPQNIR